MACRLLLFIFFGVIEGPNFFGQTLAHLPRTIFKKYVPRCKVLVSECKERLERRLGAFVTCLGPKVKGVDIWFLKLSQKGLKFPGKSI
jgi:hypothetical protein